MREPADAARSVRARLVNWCVVRKDGVVSELLWADFAGREVEGFDSGAQACSALGACTVVGDNGVVIVGDVPIQVTPAREFVEVD